MLYLIGLGLTHDSISQKGLLLARRCKKLYLETYTVDMPYTEKAVIDIIDKKVIPVDRSEVESLSIVDEAKKKDVGLLIYGSPLTATTHITLIAEAQKSGVKYAVIHNASILDAVAETGLQLYKFGKIGSIPTWDISKKFTPESFIEVLKENQSIGAHTLYLCDIGLGFHTALKQLQTAAEHASIQLSRVVICQMLGTPHQKILYRTIADALEFEGVRKPYCIIIPGKLHFVEKEILENYA